jgi:cellobiose phosphorylase
MYRLTVETLLGLQLEVDQLRITPCIPAHWPSYKIHYRYRETVYHITVTSMGEKPEHVSRVTLDGVALDGAVVNGTDVNGMGRPQGIIPLADDRREHYVEVDMS